ncbi:MAG: helix-turn-helix domain-containing protein [Defluviitaleaceae bacterium]|nr:helix-turn-helix domain-containing protein [Defluviitaleaceae bacterium]
MDNDSLEVYDFGYRLRDLRKARRLTQAQVGKMIGVHKNTIGAYENNVKTPSIKKIIKLANLFRTSTDYIFGIKDNEARNEAIYINDLSKEKQEIVLEFINLIRKAPPLEG